MSDPRPWYQQTNIYEVNVRQYTREGTFEAFGRHLPRLKDMGVQTLWFMPITPISEKGRKGEMGSYYACSDYTSVNPEFGTLEDFRNLVKNAQSMGFKVILDWVANHTGWDHRWTVEHPEWYKHEADGRFQIASGMDDIIELDFSNEAMKEAMIESMRFWVRECNLDGFRCDLASWVPLSFWLQAIPNLNATKPLFWLAEMDSLEHPGYLEAFQASYTWAWMHRSEAWYKGSLPISVLTSELARYQSAPGIKTWFTSNHDENSWNGSEYEKYGDAARALAVHSCTWPGIPLMYTGQELPNLKRLAFFEKDFIVWSDPPQLHEFYLRLLRLQTEHPALHSTAALFDVPTSRPANILGYLRKDGEEEIFVLMNLSSHQVSFEILADWLQGSYSELFTGVGINLPADKEMTLDHWGYRVFVRTTGK